MRKLWKPYAKENKKIIVVSAKSRVKQSNPKAETKPTESRKSKINISSELVRKLDPHQNALKK